MKKKFDMEILETDFKDITDVLEYDVSKVRDVRLRIGDFLTKSEFNQRKKEVKLLHFKNRK